MDLNNRKKCTHQGCSKVPSLGAVAGTNKRQSCAGHAEERVVDLKNKMCGHSGCTKRSSDDVLGATSTTVGQFPPVGEALVEILETAAPSTYTDPDDVTTRRNNEMDCVGSVCLRSQL